MGKIAAILVARLIFAGAFIVAASFKFIGMDATARYIASVGFPFPFPFPFPLFLAWVAAILRGWTGARLPHRYIFSLRP